MLNHVCFEIGVKELIAKVFCARSKPRRDRKKAEYGGLHIRGGEFISSEVEALMDTDELVGAACREIATATSDRQSVLIFASSVAHAEHVRESLE